MARQKTEPAPAAEQPKACFDPDEVECVVYTDHKGEPVKPADEPDVPAEGE